MHPIHRLQYIIHAGLKTLRSGDFGADLATVQDGLDLGPFERLGRELQSTPSGRLLLAEKPSIDLASVDVDAMRALPDGTLGREVVQHLTTAGLLQDLELPPSPFELSEAGSYAKKRWRETHDIRHVLTGTTTSIRDEIVLQAFQLGHFHNRFAMVQMAVGPFLAPCNPMRLVRDYRRAFRAGRSAGRLIGIRWESLWDRPVAELRETLRIPVCTPIVRNEQPMER